MERQDLAMAYAMKRKAQQMAKGGMCYAHGGAARKKEEWHARPCTKHGAYECQSCMGPHGHPYAEGGFVEEEKASGYEMMPKALDKENMAAEEEDNDMIERIMSQRYSEGGRVANDDEPIADEEPNQFDDLVKRDDLEFSYDGANSGDELGNERLDQDDEDLVARIMASRRKKDRMPQPA